MKKIMENNKSWSKNFGGRKLENKSYRKSIVKRYKNKNPQLQSSGAPRGPGCSGPLALPAACSCARSSAVTPPRAPVRGAPLAVCCDAGGSLVLPPLAALEPAYRAPLSLLLFGLIWSRSHRSLSALGSWHPGT